MHLLVVDPNIAFATVLKEELQRLGHSVDVCTSGASALELAKTALPDLAFLDMGLEAPDAVSLGRALRDMRADLRLVLIPTTGDALELRDDAPVIQGVLPKPFFLPELADHIASALEASLTHNDAQHPVTVVGADADPSPPDAQESLLDEALTESMDDEAPDWLAALDFSGDEEGDAEIPREAQSPVSDAAMVASRPDVTAPVSSQPTTGISRRAFRMNQGRIETLMSELVSEVGADGVILTCDTGLLTAVGSLDEAEIESISAAVVSGSQASAEVARILGREQLRFEQSIAGGSYLLYALGIRDAILAVTVSGDAALGLLRHRARATAERIAAYCTLA